MVVGLCFAQIYQTVFCKISEQFAEENCPPFVITGVNLAQNKPAYQSSLYRSEYPAKNAVDGNKDSNMFGWSCTHTAHDYPAWWLVDLQDTYNVTMVKVTNRGDCCGKKVQIC